MISHKLFTSLSAAAKKNLHYFWYIGKDQVAPIVAKKKKRSCHVKLMIVDEHIGVRVSHPAVETSTKFSPRSKETAIKIRSRGFIPRFVF